MIKNCGKRFSCVCVCTVFLRSTLETLCKCEGENLVSWFICVVRLGLVNCFGCNPFSVTLKNIQSDYIFVHFDVKARQASNFLHLVVAKIGQENTLALKVSSSKFDETLVDRKLNLSFTRGPSSELRQFEGLKQSHVFASMYVKFVPSIANLLKMQSRCHFESGYSRLRLALDRL